jgi:transposase
MVRYIGMDVHREFAQLAVVEDGLLRDDGRIGVTPEALRAWAAGLRGDDEVALEATGNSDAIATCSLRGWVGWWCPTHPRPGRSPRPR